MRNWSWKGKWALSLFSFSVSLLSLLYALSTYHLYVLIPR